MVAHKIHIQIWLVLPLLHSSSHHSSLLLDVPILECTCLSNWVLKWRWLSLRVSV